MGGIKTCQLPEGHKLPHIHFDANGTTAWEWDWKEKEQVRTDMDARVDRNTEWTDLDDFIRREFSLWERFKMWVTYRKARKNH